MGRVGPTFKKMKLYSKMSRDDDEVQVSQHCFVLLLRSSTCQARTPTKSLAWLLINWGRASKIRTASATFLTKGNIRRCTRGPCPSTPPQAAAPTMQTLRSSTPRPPRPPLRTTKTRAPLPSELGAITRRGTKCSTGSQMCGSRFVSVNDLRLLSAFFVLV